MIVAITNAMKYNFLKEHVRADRVAQAMSPCLANVKP
jgi:hypothetical protein